MQVGSIVVVLKLPSPPPLLKDFIKWLPVDDERTPYTLATIAEHKPNKLSVTFEEGVIGYAPNGREIEMSSKYVREILPPSPIDEEIQYILDEPITKFVVRTSEKTGKQYRRYLKTDSNNLNTQYETSR